MSKTTKRKHVVKEVLEDYILPSGDQQVSKILEVRGNNLHMVETGSGETYLASMPAKFRKNVWIKRGDYVLIQPIKEGDRVKAEICTILYKEQIKYIKQNNLWPKKFEEKQSVDSQVSNPSIVPSGDCNDDSLDSDDDQLPEKWVNPNRPAATSYMSDSSEESS